MREEYRCSTMGDKGEMRYIICTDFEEIRIAH